MSNPLTSPLHLMLQPGLFIVGRQARPLYGGGGGGAAPTSLISRFPVDLPYRGKVGRQVVSYCQTTETTASGLEGFPQRLENLENESTHGKFMEDENMAKSHGIL